MEWDDVAEVFLGTLLAGIVLLFVVVPLARRKRRRRRWSWWALGR